MFSLVDKRAGFSKPRGCGFVIWLCQKKISFYIESILGSNIVPPPPPQYFLNFLNQPSSAKRDNCQFRGVGSLYCFQTTILTTQSRFKCPGGTLLSSRICFVRILGRPRTSIQKVTGVLVRCRIDRRIQ